jgi:hypothetical protein
MGSRFWLTATDWYQTSEPFQIPIKVTDELTETEMPIMIHYIYDWLA